MNDRSSGISRGSFSSGSNAYLFFAALVSLYVFAVVPLSVFRLYRNEFASSFIEVGGYLLAASVAGGIVLAAVLRFTPARVRGWVARALLGLVVIGWYNLNFLDYKGRIVGVDLDVVEGRYAPYELGIFAAIVAAIAGARNLNRHLVTIMALVCAVGLVSLAAQGDGRSERKSEYLVVPDTMFAYSPDQNVLHVVLDGMQQVILQDLITKQPDQRARLDGFWSFSNALTPTDVTFLSFNAFYTGIPFTGEGRITRYVEASRPAGQNAKSPPGFMGKLRERGFDLDVLSAGANGVTENLGYRSFVLSDLSNTTSAGLEALKVADYTLLRVMPWTLKPAIYRKGGLALSSLGRKTRTHHATDFLRAYPSKVTVSSARPTYKLVHLLTPHGPWTTGPSCQPEQGRDSMEAIWDQGRCTLRAVLEMIDGLRELSIYDRTLILVHGDHGVCLPDGLPAVGPASPPCIGNAHPMLLIKPIGSRGALRDSSHAATLTDLPTTVLHALGVESPFAGVPLFTDAQPADRERHFFVFEPDRVRARRQDRVDAIQRYTVIGDVRDAAAWSREVTQPSAPQD
jgi:hypothetical protein